MINRLYGDYPDLTGVRRVLVIVLKNIGDVVLSSPVFGVLKHAMPECTVDAFVNSGTEDIFAGNPDIGRVLVLDRKALKKGAFSRLREEVRLA
ncbi:MAG: putative lipopolysaccharide heptosyltransferase III, partial [Deltaproteobacteria bacterium]|nr:putative lipopolysaccharide heptosyltransferase III [Deltaproteobacteria bacterium]